MRCNFFAYPEITDAKQRYPPHRLFMARYHAAGSTILRAKCTENFESDLAALLGMKLTSHNIASRHGGGHLYSVVGRRNRILRDTVRVLVGSVIGVHKIDVCTVAHLAQKRMISLPTGSSAVAM